MRSPDAEQMRAAIETAQTLTREHPEYAAAVEELLVNQPPLPVLAESAQRGVLIFAIDREDLTRLLQVEPAGLGVDAEDMEIEAAIERCTGTWHSEPQPGEVWQMIVTEPHYVGEGRRLLAFGTAVIEPLVTEGTAAQAEVDHA